MKSITKTLLLATSLAIAGPISVSYAATDIYGSQLMTEQERAEYNQKLNSIKTNEERQEFMEDHREKMKERAQEQGISLPDRSPQSGGMKNPGTGTGMDKNR